MIPILTYHAIDDRPSPVCISRDTFARQVAALAEHGYHSYSLAALCADLAAGRALPERAVVITFDDGYTSVHDYAWPLLQRYGFGATMFVVTGYCGRDNRWPTQPEGTPAAALMTWAQVRRLAEEGCEIGGHTHTHPPLSTLGEAETACELAEARAAMAENLGQAPAVFAYPYGDMGGANKAAVWAIRGEFSGAVSTDLGLVTAGSNRYALPRIDALYLHPAAVSRLQTAGFRQYLAMRQQLRRLRRAWRHDWQGARELA